MQAEKIIRELNKLKTGAPCSDVHSRDMAIEEAKAAVEKQKPKKPTSYKTDFGNNEVLFFRCVECKRVAATQFAKNKFCCNCGQALDWSDTK